LFSDTSPESIDHICAKIKLCRTGALPLETGYCHYAQDAFRTDWLPQFDDLSIRIGLRAQYKPRAIGDGFAPFAET
jgi:hypothetical protein